MGIFFGFTILIYLFITLGISNEEVSSFILFNPNARTIFMQGYKGNGHLFFFIINMPLLLFIRMWATIQYTKKFSRTKTQKLIDAFLVICVLGSMALIGGRLQLLGAVIGLFSIYHYSIQTISIKSQFFAALFLVMSAGVLGVFLQTDFYLSDDQVDFFSPYRLLVRIYESYDAFDNGVIALSKFDKFYFGLTILEDIFLTYIPRTIFPFKPEVFGVVRIQNDIMPSLYEYAGLSATYPMGFVAEIYLNFGFAGLIVLPFLFGVFLKSLQNNALVSGLYLCLFAFTLSLMPMVVRGFGSFLSAIIMSLIFLKVIFMFSKFKWH
jgi:oligosaccharide repeat unit polymerase